MFSFGTSSSKGNNNPEKPSNNSNKYDDEDEEEVIGGAKAGEKGLLGTSTTLSSPRSVIKEGKIQKLEQPQYQASITLDDANIRQYKDQDDGKKEKEHQKKRHGSDYDQSIPNDILHHPQHPPPTYLYALVGIACLNSCNLGYDVGAAGGAAILMQEEFEWTEFQTEVFIGCVNIIAVIGALLASPLCDKYGRRRGFFNSSIFFIIGMTCTMFSHSYIVALIGRFLTGLGVGLGLAIDPLYISEVSPPHHRGGFVACAEVAVNFGILLGFIIDYLCYPLPEGVNWRVMIGLGLIMPTILIILSCTVMPESPRWLIQRGRVSEATAILKRTYPDDVNIDLVVEEIKEHIEHDKKAAESGWQPICKPTPAVRLMLLAGVGVAISQQINGSESLVYYSPVIFERVGFTSRAENFGMTILVGITKLLFIIISVFKVDDYGRRPLLLTSTGGMIISLAMIAITATNESMMIWNVVFICTFIGCFSVGIGPLTWVVCSEVFPTSIRAKAMSISTSLNRLVSGIVSITTLTLTSKMGVPGYFFFYASLTLLSLLYIFILVPETKDKTLEEITDFFEKRAETYELALSESGGGNSYFQETSKEVEMTLKDEERDKKTNFEPGEDREADSCTKV